MATYHPFQMDNYLQHTLSADSRRSFFNDDDESILDDNILDNNMLDSTLDVPMDRRRESTAIFSPQTDWDFDRDMGLQAGPADDSTAVPATFEHSNGTNNPFIKLEQAQPAYAQQHNWNQSGACTPAVYDNNAFNGTTFDESGAYLAPAMGATGATSAYDSNVHITPHSVFQSGAMDTSMPSSPAVKAWGAEATSAEQADGPSMAKRMRPSSPAPRAHSPLHVVRRDGIRKKNARFDIPAERTLMNIDQLIARSQDENEIKELKQQKRLLRNRQAALDSRQRKKQHTERLEEEKKLHSAVISELEEKLQALQMQEEQMHQRFAEVVRERDFLAHKADTLQLEKEEMVRAHTIESGELRKKNSYLQDQLEKMQDTLDRTDMGHQNSSGFSDAFNFEADFDLDDTVCWNDPMPAVHNEASRVQEKSDEKPAAPGLLLILLLCGAFVASSKTSTSSLPPLPKQIQTASASVLQNIFQDAGVSEATRVHAVEPMASGTADSWAVAKSDVPHMIGLESTMNVINSFDKTTAEQQHGQFMQLTPAEYNDVTSNNFLRDPEPVSHRSASRRRIQENLANMRNSKGTAAEVYTRSLLWDRVDAEVVRRFAAFTRQAQGQQATGNNESGGATAHS